MADDLRRNKLQVALCAPNEPANCPFGLSRRVSQYMIVSCRRSRLQREYRRLLGQALKADLIYSPCGTSSICVTQLQE